MHRDPCLCWRLCSPGADLTAQIRWHGWRRCKSCRLCSWRSLHASATGRKCMDPTRRPHNGNGTISDPHVASCLASGAFAAAAQLVMSRLVGAPACISEHDETAPRPVLPQGLRDCGCPAAYFVCAASPLLVISDSVPLLMRTPSCHTQMTELVVFVVRSRPISPATATHVTPSGSLRCLNVALSARLLYLWYAPDGVQVKAPEV